MMAAIVGLTACEYEFDNGSLTKETSIYVEGTPSNTDTNVFRIVKTLPYNVAENIKDSAILNVTEVSSIELLKDGASQKVYYAEEAVGSIPRGRYYTIGAYKPGEKLSLKVEMEGEKKASAETVIPYNVNWVYSLTPVESEDEDRLIYRISIDFDNIPNHDDFYGINIEVSYIMTYYNEDGSVNTYYGNGYTYPANPPIDNGDDIEDVMAGEGDSHVFQYNGIYLFDDSSFKEGRCNITYDYDMRTYYWGPSWEKAKTKAYGDENWKYPVRSHCEIMYRVSLRSISRELFRWYASRYNAGNNPLAELGLCPPSFAYGNIRNGIGCFAGVYGTSSDWVTLVDRWQDIDNRLY